MSTKKRPSRSKEETLTEFDTIVDNHTGKEVASAKDAAAIEAHKKSVLAQIKNMTPEAVTQAVTAAQFDIQRTLGNISQLLVEKTSELHTVTEAIAAQTEELTRLHGVDVVQSTIDTLIAEHQAASAQFAKEQHDARQAWNESIELRNKADRERREEQKKAWEREVADYSYVTAQQRRLDEDNWKQQLTLLQRQERDRLQALEKDWAQRTADLVAHEKELIDLRDRVAAFPTLMDAEAKKQVAIVSNTLSRDHKHAIEMLTQQASSAAAIAAAQTKSLTETNEQLRIALAESQTKLQAAYQTNTELSGKALEAASGHQALTELRALTSNRSEGSNGPAKRS